MKHLAGFACVTVAVLLAACSTQPSAPDALASLDDRTPLLRIADDAPRETILLVSLDDGSVIMQTIQTPANICFKQNSSSTTTCLTQGAPIFDAGSDTVIGYEMIEDEIQLVAKER